MHRYRCIHFVFFLLLVTSIPNRVSWLSSILDVAPGRCLTLSSHSRKYLRKSSSSHCRMTQVMLVVHFNVELCSCTCTCLYVQIHTYTCLQAKILIRPVGVLECFLFKLARYEIVYIKGVKELIHHRDKTSGL